MQKALTILKYASSFYKAAFSSRDQWAAGIVNQAFVTEMGREPTPAERQIVMAVSDLESNYGRGWKGPGKGSHNWGAVQTRSKGPSFQYTDSSAQGKYQVGFKSYPDDVSGAADVVSLLFKSNRKQTMPDPKNAFRVLGKTIDGPARGELNLMAAQQGDTLAFSRAMWYTSYFEGTAKDWTERIRHHAEGLQNRINRIASSLGETPAWSIKSNHYLPVTNNQSVIQEISQMSPRAGEQLAQPVQQAQPLAQAPADQMPNSQQLEQSVNHLLTYLWS